MLFLHIVHLYAHPSYTFLAEDAVDFKMFSSVPNFFGASHMYNQPQYYNKSP